MKKKKDNSVKIKVRYTSEKSYRWGLCMRLAKFAYASTLSEHQIEENIEMILENFTNINK
jgi:hypothetical protein